MVFHAFEKRQIIVPCASVRPSVRLFGFSRFGWLLRAPEQQDRRIGLDIRLTDVTRLAHSHLFFFSGAFCPSILMRSVYDLAPSFVKMLEI